VTSQTKIDRIAIWECKFPLIGSPFYGRGEKKGISPFKFFRFLEGWQSQDEIKKFARLPSWRPDIWLLLRLCCFYSVVVGWGEGILNITKSKGHNAWVGSLFCPCGERKKNQMLGLNSFRFPANPRLGNKCVLFSKREARPWWGSAGRYLFFPHVKRYPHAAISFLISLLSIDEWRFTFFEEGEICRW